MARCDYFRAPSLSDTHTCKELVSCFNGRGKKRESWSVFHCEGQSGASAYCMMLYDILLSFTTGMPLKWTVMSNLYVCVCVCACALCGHARVRYTVHCLFQCFWHCWVFFWKHATEVTGFSKKYHKHKVRKLVIALCDLLTLANIHRL